MSIGLDFNLRSKFFGEIIRISEVDEEFEGEKNKNININIKKSFKDMF
jgi:hypothetical protein